MVVKTPVIAIDIGTQSASVSVHLNGSVQIIPNRHGHLTTPSCIAFTEYERFVGEPALAQLVHNPRNTVYDFKTLMGMKFSELTHFNGEFRLINQREYPSVQIEHNHELKALCLEELAALIIKQLKEDAEVYLGCRVNEAVLTVPTSFNHMQREAMKNAGIIAGLNILRLVNETSAAVVSAGSSKRAKLCLVVSIGAGFCDFSVVRVQNGFFETLSTFGNAKLNGNSFTDVVLEYLMADFEDKFTVTMRNNARSVEKLRAAVETAKISLSKHKCASIHIDDLYDGIEYFAKISRHKFEDLAMNLFNQLVSDINAVLFEARLHENQINEVILAGECTKTPKIQDIISHTFLHAELRVLSKLDIVAGASTLLTAGNLLLDVAGNPFTCEINDVRHEIIAKNAPVPQKVTRIIDANKFSIYEGERPLADFNLTSGQLVEVTFTLDMDGILSIVALNAHMINNNVHLSPNHLHDLFLQWTGDETERKNHRNRLYDYVMNLKQVMDDVGENLSGEDKAFVSQECDCCLKWMCDNKEDDFERKYRDVMRVCSPIVAKVFAPVVRSEEVS